MSPPAPAPDPRVRSLFDGEAQRHHRLFSGGFTGWLARRDEAALLALAAPAPGVTLLDVGCGSGHHARLLSEHGCRVSAVDLSPEMVALARPFVEHAEVAALETLALGRTFERVVCLGVLDFVSDPALCFASLARHLQPGGRLVIQVPRRGLGGQCYRLGYRLARRVDPRLYSRAELDRLAAQHGLVPAGARATFLHCLHAAWDRPA